MSLLKKYPLVFSIYFSLLFFLFSCASNKYKESRSEQYPSFELPFAYDVKSRIFQAWHGDFSHKGAHEYAVDFKLEKNTPVLAARSGKVVEIEERFEKGGNSKSYLSQANFIILDHGDSTFTEYFHLAPHSSKVKKGDYVKTGQLLALSGETGFVTIPHLHFMFFKRDPQTREKISLPFCFKIKNDSCLEPRQNLLWEHVP